MFLYDSVQTCRMMIQPYLAVVVHSLPDRHVPNTQFGHNDIGVDSSKTRSDSVIRHLGTMLIFEICPVIKMNFTSQQTRFFGNLNLILENGHSKCQTRFVCTIELNFKKFNLIVAFIIYLLSMEPWAAVKKTLT